MFLKVKDEAVLDAVERNRAYIERFCNPETLEIGVEVNAPEKAMTSIITGVEIILPLEGLINIDEEIARLGKEREKLIKEVERVQKKLANEGFVKKAPAKVIEEERAKEKDYTEKLAAVEARIQELKG